MLTGPFEEADARGIIDAAGPLHAGLPMVWRDRSNHAGHRWCVTTIHDRFGIAIPGLTVQFEARAPVRVDACLFLFSIYRNTRSGRHRVYQIEVCPREKRSHRMPDGTFLFGPHEHWGEAGAPIDAFGLSCEDWPGSLREFLRRRPVYNLSVSDL